MAFMLNEEQTLLQDSARRFFQEQMPVSHMRSLRDSANPDRFDRKLWQNMGALGLTGTLIDESFGGTNFGAVGLCLVLEEAGRTLAPSPLFSTSLLNAAIIIQGGNEQQKQDLLPKIVTGEIIIALALEESAHHAPDQLNSKAEKSGSNYKLSGKKIFVIDGMSADKIIVAARTESGTTLFLLDAHQIERTPMLLADNRNYAMMTLDDLSVSADQIIGGENQGQAILEPALDLARIGIASEMLGGVREVFDRSLTYLKERKQFGKIIGSFQALKHRAAKIYCEIELSHTVVRAAASAYEQHANNIPIMASLAKARLAQCARLTTNEALQFHGGMGMTDEVDIGLFLKRARVQAQIFGDAHFHHARFADLEGF